MTIQPPATATASRAWTTTPVEWLPIPDLQLILTFYRKIETEDFKIALTTARGYVRPLQKFDGVLAAYAPHVLALPLAARLTTPLIQLFVSARSQVTTAPAVHRDLQTLIEAVSFLDDSADLTALREAQRALYIPRKQRKIVARHRLSLTKKEFELKFPSLAAGLDAERVGARVEKLSTKSRGNAVDELRAYIDALSARDPSLVVDDAKALFTPKKIDIYIDALQRRCETGVVRALQRLRTAIRRIDDSDLYDWVDERIKKLGALEQDGGQRERLAASMTPEDGKKIAAYFDDDRTEALVKEWSGWSNSTKNNVRDAFLYCLGSLQRTAPELVPRPIAERFPPYAIDGIIEDQLQTCSTATIALRLRSLKQMLDRADSHSNHDWILARASALSNSHPHERKTKEYTPVLEVVRKAFAVMDDCLLRFEILENLQHVASLRRVAEKYRDGLVLAFLCFLAPRARALAEIRFGATLKQDEAGFLYDVVGKKWPTRYEACPASA
jgi:hypothetical protein